MLYKAFLVRLPKGNSLREVTSVLDKTNLGKMRSVPIDNLPVSSLVIFSSNMLKGVNYFLSSS